MFDLHAYQRRLTEAASFLEDCLGARPRIGIIAGTGLGGLVEENDIRVAREYGEIPHFPTSTVSGHAGRLVSTSIAGQEAVILQGRCHLYEGYEPQELILPIRALTRCGLRGLLVTNAAGGLNPAFRAGDIMLITDHINMMGSNCLSGPHDESWGARFPELSCAYDPSLRKLAIETAAQLDIGLHRGVYVGVRGPALETPAETRWVRQIGGDAVGMSTVQEVIACAQAGVPVLGFSCITNVNDPDCMAPTCLADVLAVAAAAAPALKALIHGVISRWSRPDEGRA